MFDTINGLPLHPLAVHAVVVLLPLAALATVAVAAKAAWRRHSVALIIANFATMVMTFMAKESGEKLANRLDGANILPAGVHDHGELGDMLFALSFALFVGAIAIHFLRSRGGVTMKAVTGLAAVGALAILVVAVMAGETGATMVWKDVIANTHG